MLNSCVALAILVSSVYFLEGDPPSDKKLLSLEIHVDNLKPEESDLIIAVYNSSGEFLGDHPYYSRIIPIGGVTNTNFRLELPKGMYSIAIYQDHNRNGTLDKNFFNYPLEPFGFSNDYKPLFRPPSWSNTSFLFEGEQRLLIHLN